MDEMRIVILGKTGSGKSSLANTILREDVFQIGHTANPETSECQSVTRHVDGRNITLIDTPGLFDTGRPEGELKLEIVTCFTEFANGPHAFLIVLKVGRFTDQEQDVINKINQYFSEEAFKYATVLFTHGDDLQEGQTIEEYLSNNQRVSDLMEKCGGRCHVVDNKHWKNNQLDDYRSNQFQVKQLMKTIDHMIEENKGSCYTNKMIQAVEKLIQEEEEKIRQSPGNMTEEEIRKKAKKRALKRLLLELAAEKTGLLLGGLLGVGLLVGGAAAGSVGLTVCSLLVGCALAAAIGFKGCDAAKEAVKLPKAAKRAANVAYNKVISVFKGQEKAAKNKSETEPLIGFDS